MTAVDNNSEKLAALDYCFAWRWLLPLQDSDKLAIYGLSDHEQLWWQQRYPIADIPEHADAALFALDTLSTIQIEKCLAQHPPHWLCAWGSGKEVARLSAQLQGYGSVRTYGLLPAGMPRVVVPLSSPAAASAGLRLHRPGRLVARAALKLAAVMARFGHYQLLQKQVLLIACREQVCTPAGAVNARFLPAAPTGDFALYLGTPDANRKTVALPVPPAAKPGIIKAADNPDACKALRNEAQALTAMGKTALNTCVPALLAFHDDGIQVSLTQEYRQRQLVSAKRQHNAVLDFLRTMATVECRHKTLGEYLARTSERLPAELAALRQHLSTLPQATPLILHRCHGDFAPWNCAWSQQGLFVYDWEASHSDGLALSDAFYYVLAPLLHIHHTADGKKALDAVKAFVRPLLQLPEIATLDFRLYLALWLLQQAEAPELYCNIAVALTKSWAS